MYAKTSILYKNGFCWGPIGEPQWFVVWLRFGWLETATTAVWFLGANLAPNCGFWRTLAHRLSLYKNNIKIIQK